MLSKCCIFQSRKWFVFLGIYKVYLNVDELTDTCGSCSGMRRTGRDQTGEAEMNPPSILCLWEKRKCPFALPDHIYAWEGGGHRTLTLGLPEGGYVSVEGPFD